MLLANTSEQKDNFIANFKEPITTYQLGFVMKVLRKCCRHRTSQKLPKHIQISPKAQIKCLTVIFLNFDFKKHIFKSLYFVPKKHTFSNS